MGETRKKIYQALVDGASEGHTSSDLYEFVKKRCAKTSGRRIVRASLLALTDPNVKDPVVLDAIYALAIKHRMDDVRSDDEHDDDDTKMLVPLIEKS